MAKKTNNGVNKSAAIREIYQQNPDIKAKEVVSKLAAQGIKASANLVYLIKGQAQGEKSHRRKVHKTATKVAQASGSLDSVKTILKVKALAVEVGSYDTLKALVEALAS